MDRDFRMNGWLVQPQLDTVRGHDGRLIPLEPKVMAVLVYLSDHAGEVLSKERIIRAVWPDTFVTDDVLTGAISDLRRAFQDDPRSPRFIQTIPKRGYRLIAEVSPLTSPASRYEVIEKINRGAMGEVFLARDRELGRKVALKFLREEMDQDETARKRLLHGARAAAALDHPNICRIFDAGKIDGKTFVAMEYVEGRSLKQRLEKEGRAALQEAVQIALEIANGLEAAHEKGIAHLDLKPASILITPQGHVKIMDFGLAKRMLPADEEPDSSVGLETARTSPEDLPYAAPEQLRGEETGPATDIFSFGLILYEMISGRHPFKNERPAELGSSILNDDAAPLGTNLPDIPAALEDLVSGMLARNPELRCRAMGDIRLRLDRIFKEIGERKGQAGIDVSGTAGLAWAPGWSGFAVRWRTPLLLLAVVVVTALLSRLVWNRRLLTPPSPDQSIHAEIIVVPADRLSGGNTEEEEWYGLERPSRTAMALSPDGTRLVYSGVAGNFCRLYLRIMNSSADASPIPGTEGGSAPFFSPDGQKVGFWVGRQLKTVALDGSQPLTVCSAVAGLPCGADWLSGETIVFGRMSGSVQRLSVAKGRIEPVTWLDVSRLESSHRLPHVLPGGKALLFTSLRSESGENPEIVLQVIATGERRILIDNAADARYSPTGHIVFAREGALMAVPFDLARMSVTGSERLVLPHVMQASGSWDTVSTGAAQFSFSNSGHLVYVPGDTLPEEERFATWVTKAGRLPDRHERMPSMLYPHIAPDGTRIAYTSQNSIWIYDLVRERPLREISGLAAVHVIWSSAGNRLTFSARSPDGGSNLYSLPLAGDPAVEALTTGPGTRVPSSWSPDGELLAFVSWDPQTREDIWVLHRQSRKLEPVLNTSSREGWPEFSPDGRLLAYATDRTSSGNMEVFVESWPVTGNDRIQVSLHGGFSPAWADGGKKLFFRDEAGSVYAVDVSAAAKAAVGRPVRVVEGLHRYLYGEPIRDYDVAHNGQGFLLVERVALPPTPVRHMNLVTYWFPELTRLFQPEQR